VLEKRAWTKLSCSRPCWLAEPRLVGSVGKTWKVRSRDGLFVRVQTFNFRDDESSEEAFNNPVSLQGRVTPPCCGKAKGGQAAHTLQFYGQRASAL